MVAEKGGIGGGLPCVSSPHRENLNKVRWYNADGR